QAPPGPHPCRPRRSWPDLDARVMQLPFQIADHKRAGMEHAGRESRIHAGLSKHRAEVLDGARTPGGNERHLADLPHPAQLLDVITATHAIAPHAIEDDLARAAPLRLADPFEHVAPRFARALRVAGELVDPVAVLGELTVDADLVARACGELHDVAHAPVVAKAHALYALAGADVEAGNDASGKNGRSSSGVSRSSNSALPLTAAATPIWASARRSAALRTPPEACQASRGQRDSALR